MSIQQVFIVWLLFTGLPGAFLSLGLTVNRTGRILPSRASIVVEDEQVNDACGIRITKVKMLFDRINW